MLLTQCTDLARRLEALQARRPERGLFAISGLSSDLQRVYAVELILMQLDGVRVQKEVAEAIGNLLETISVTYETRSGKEGLGVAATRPGSARLARRSVLMD